MSVVVVVVVVVVIVNTSTANNIHITHTIARTMYYASGHRYYGMWDQSKLHGLGVYEFPNGERYVGMLQGQ